MRFACSQHCAFARSGAVSDENFIVDPRLHVLLGIKDAPYVWRFPVSLATSVCINRCTRSGSPCTPVSPPEYVYADRSQLVVTFHDVLLLFARASWIPQPSITALHKTRLPSRFLVLQVCFHPKIIKIKSIGDRAVPQPTESVWELPGRASASCLSLLGAARELEGW
jgi:hypothetical protein